MTDGVFHNRLLIYNLPGAREQLLAQHRAIHNAVAAGDPQRARKAAMDHIDFVSRAMIEAERTGDWQRVARLRLSQRSSDRTSNSRRARANATG